MAEAWNHQVWISKCCEEFSLSLKNASTFPSDAPQFLKKYSLKVSRFCLFVLLRTASIWWVWRTGEVILIGKLQLDLILCFIVVFISMWLAKSFVFKLLGRHIFFIMNLVNIIWVLLFFFFPSPAARKDWCYLIIRVKYVKCKVVLSYNHAYNPLNLRKSTELHIWYRSNLSSS